MRLLASLSENRRKAPPFLERVFVRETIFRCDENAPLLIRWKLLNTPWFRLCLHIFHRSDEDRELHDHPWAFFSLILWNGYVEVRPARVYRARMAGCEAAHRRVPLGLQAALFGDRSTYEHRRILPGTLLFRPARWAHRIEIRPGRPSVSLVLMLRKEREWGFFTTTGWRHWRKFLPSRDCS